MKFKSSEVLCNGGDFAFPTLYCNTDNVDARMGGIGIHASLQGRAALVFHDGTRKGVSRADSLARVMAVAPEMLTMLKLVEARIQLERSEDDQCVMLAGVHDDIKALIARAEARL